MPMLIKGGRVFDPGRIDGLFDIRVRGEKIESVEPTLNPLPDDEVLEAVGKIITPGLIDLHVHLREPGHEYKETIASGLLAAVAGGFTAVCAMANTHPVNDCPEVTAFMLQKAREAGLARLYPVAAVSPGQKGQALCEYAELKNAGVVALSDDGQPVQSSLLMRRAMEYAKGLDLPIISHCEELSLVGEGVMNEGALATRMGLAGIPNAAESIMVMRDIALCALTGARLHIAHVSTAESVRAIREAKERGLPVTAESAPHYFTLTEEAVRGYNTHARMNPPLRGPADRAAIRKALADGTLDAIATDHAPHSTLEKDIEFALAANGIIGLESALALGLALVREGIWSLPALITRMSTGPARILGLDNHIRPGNSADLTIIEPDATYTLRPESLRSRSANTPFMGWTMQGRACTTIVAGRIVYQV